jgi:hypothetical protein
MNRPSRASRRSKARRLESDARPFSAGTAMSHKAAEAEGSSAPTPAQSPRALIPVSMAASGDTHAKSAN